MKKKNDTITIDRKLTIEQLKTITSALNNNIVDIREVKEDYQDWYIMLLEAERSIKELIGIYDSIKEREEYKLNIEIVEE